MKMKLHACGLATVLALIVGCSASPGEPPAASPGKQSVAADAVAAEPAQTAEPQTAPVAAEPPATQAPAATRASYDECLSHTQGVTPAIQECISAEHAYQDKRLNDAYKTLLSQWPADRKVDLRERQRAWIKQRDADCASDDEPEPGQGQVLEANSCLVDATAARAGELERMTGGAQ
ncbi:lysozyme inhibitor LprI family protein [Lysobacter sp. CA199]|uniref:lysozyme inhibitor LprI family protein n=1 Tax=Lysobacter sp. CA199 TaxID=3455608 RepID=UPI003F8D6714